MRFNVLTISIKGFYSAVRALSGIGSGRPGGSRERRRRLEKSYAMGIDEGTTGARTLIFDGEASRELTQHYPRVGWREAVKLIRG